MMKKLAFMHCKIHIFQSARQNAMGAATDSALNKNLVQIQNYPSELLRLKLVGVGKILTGIFMLLFGIMIALVMMPIRLGKVIYGMQNIHKSSD